MDKKGVKSKKKIQEKNCVFHKFHGECHPKKMRKKKKFKSFCQQKENSTEPRWVYFVEEKKIAERSDKKSFDLTLGMRMKLKIVSFLDEIRKDNSDWHSQQDGN